MKIENKNIEKQIFAKIACLYLCFCFSLKNLRVC